jgi:CHAT domain-containing protein
MSERARARSLLESVAGGAGIAQGTGETWTELRQVRRALNAKAVALGNARPGTTRTAVTRDIDELSTRAAVLEGQLRREQPALGAIATAEPISVARLQQEMLDDRTVLVEYMLGRTRSYAWVISRAHFASYVLAPRAQIEEAAVHAREIASPPAQRSSTASLAPGAALSRLLMPPLRAISPGQRVLIVAPGVLQDVAFAALPMNGGGRPLVMAHELIHAPSAAVLLAVRTAHDARTAPRRGIAVFADPVFEPTDPRVTQRATAPPPPAAAPAAPAALDRVQRGSEGAELVRLPFTGLEAERIASVLPAGDVMMATGFAANAAALKRGAANGFRIVHFATHGVLNTRTPELSGLVLSLVDEQGRPQDGFLRLHEVENLHLNADLVVLSGCETARGRRVDGEGTIGLTRGFLETGARAVVASLWRVDDLATAELMQAFYTNLLRRKLPAPAALRAAQLQLAASPRWAQPYYWAGFVVQGDWR